MTGEGRQRVVEASAARGEPLERELVARALREPAALDPARIDAVARVDALLTEAAAHGAALREAEALSSLAEAARQCEQLGDVPGAAAWCAEAQRQLGLVAAHAGLDELAGSALRRAVALEPARALLPAEAPPLLVERYEAVRAALASAPDGELRVQASVPGARVFLDDQPRGASPMSLRAKVGRHLLRVEAPGHRPYGAFVDVLAGRRPALRVELSELPVVATARALARAASERSYARVPALLAALSSLGLRSALIVEASASGRRLAVRCDARRCLGPSRLEPDAALASVHTGDADALASAELLDARHWLATPPPADGDADAPWSTRWYVWGSAILIGAAGVAAAVLLQPEPERELRVVVEPGPAE